MDNTHTQQQTRLAPASLDEGGVPFRHPSRASFLRTFFQKNAYSEFLELSVDSYTFADSTTFTFTGKERDSETGFSYFGARYYDPDLSGLFLSVDPMSDKYPVISPYSYCAWNPVRLVDPDGRVFNPVYDDKGIYLGNTKEGFTGEPIVIDSRRLQQCVSIEGNGIQELDCQTVLMYGKTFDDIYSQLSDDAKEKIYTHIVSELEGSVVGDHSFTMSQIGNKISLYKNNQPIPADYATDTKASRIYARHEYNFFETTVENVQSTILYHEWYGHLIMGWGNGNNTAIASQGGTHYMCYLFVIISPSFNKTTTKYRDFYKKMFESFFK